MPELDTVLIDIPSFSPETGQFMLRIREGIIRRIRAGDLPPGVIEELQRYADALGVTLHYSLIHQKAAINQFERLLKTMAEDTNQ